MRSELLKSLIRNKMVTDGFPQKWRERERERGRERERERERESSQDQ